MMPCLVTPRARIRFWRGLAGDSVQLGEDVFLECEVAANPAVYNVTWRHNVRPTVELQTNIREDFTITEKQGPCEIFAMVPLKLYHQQSCPYIR